MHAISNREKLYSVLCMMAGVVFFFGTVLGDIGSSIRISDHKRAVYRHRLDAVIDYMVSFSFNAHASAGYAISNMYII